MTLGGALQIGRSALLANQAAIEVAGNNLANLATPGYRRQTIVLAPARTQELQQGVFVGRGVQIQGIVRQVDNALEGRIRNNISDQASSLARRDVLSQIEALQNEFTDSDLSSYLGALFNSFSELANNPQDNSLRTLVLRQGDNLANFAQSLRSELDELRQQVDGSISATAIAVNNLLEQIANVDRQVVTASRGTNGAPGLRDTRDSLLSQLSELIDISVNEQASGSMDVFVGSTPIILSGINRGVEIKRTTLGDQLQIDLVLKTDQSIIDTQSGRIGALINAREADINAAVDELDSYINTLIFEFNKVHSNGQGLGGVDGVTATNRVQDIAATLNQAAANLDFTPVHGSFQLNVTQKSTGQRTSSTIKIDLDGIDPSADTSLEGLVTAINAVDDVQASITPDGRIKINAASTDFQISFSEDSSGILAALGLNTFFAGSNAQDIQVNQVINTNPSLIAASLSHNPGDNANSLALSQLRDKPVDAFEGLSLSEKWARHVEDFAVRLGQTSQQLEAESLVGDNLAAQQQSISGVNADEEAINLLAFQRAYQSSARYLQVIDELLDALLNLV